MILLKHNTPTDVILGCFIDDTDGKTPETALTITQADVRVSKNAAAYAQKTDATSGTHREHGYYMIDLGSTDTNTLGMLDIHVHISGALPVYQTFMVVMANTWDSVCGSDTLHADLTQIDGATQSATDLKDFADAGYDPATNKVQGVVLTDTTTTNTDMVGTNGANTVVPDAAGVAATPAEVASALSDIHLDHLLAVNYDPASKPGVATALLNELVENDGGVSRYTANALEQAPTGGSAPTAVENRQEMDSNSTRLSAIEADTAGIAGSAMRGTDNAALASALTTHDGKLDTVDTNVDSILVDTGTTIPADLTTMKQTTAGTYNRDTDSLEAIRDRGDSAWSAAAGNPNVLIDTTIATLSTQTSFTLTAGSDDDDAYKDQAIVIYDASNADYPSVRKVSGYTGATKTITLDTAADFTATTGDGIKTFVTAPGTTAPTAGQVADAVWDELKAGHTVADTYGDYLDDEITSRNATTPPTVVAIRTEMDSSSTRLAAIETDTTGLNGSAMRGTDSAALATALTTHDGKLDTVDGIVDAILIDTAGLNGSAMRGTDGANTTTPDIAGTAAGLHTTTDALVTTVDGVVDAVLVDTNELQTNQGNWSTATSVIVSDKTGFALSDAGVDAILDEMIEGTHSLREMIRLLASALVGKVSGGGTATIVFRDIDDTKNRIVATVTAEGNRTAMSLTED